MVECIVLHRFVKCVVSNGYFIKNSPLNQLITSKWITCLWQHTTYFINPRWKFCHLTGFTIRTHTVLRKYHLRNRSVLIVCGSHLIWSFNRSFDRKTQAEALAFALTAICICRCCYYLEGILSLTQVINGSLFVVSVRGSQSQTEQEFNATKAIRGSI